MKFYDRHGNKRNSKVSASAFNMIFCGSAIIGEIATITNKAILRKGIVIKMRRK